MGAPPAQSQTKLLTAGPPMGADIAVIDSVEHVRQPFTHRRVQVRLPQAVPVDVAHHHAVVERASRIPARMRA